MRLLLDSSVWGPTGTGLRAAGHDVVWVGDFPADPGDEAILVCAYREKRVLVTLDNDFGELAVRRGLPQCGILRRAMMLVAHEASICLNAIEVFVRSLRPGELSLRLRAGFASMPPRTSTMLDCSVRLCTSAAWFIPCH